MTTLKFKATYMGGSNGEQVYQLPCNVCAETEWVSVREELVDRYLRGDLVQDVFPEPEFDSAYREQMIGLRSGYHVCNNCWSSVFAEEEKSYTVWVGGVEVNDYYLTFERASELADEWREDGYDDVVIEHVRIVED